MSGEIASSKSQRSADIPVRSNARPFEGSDLKRLNRIHSKENHEWTLIHTNGMARYPLRAFRQPQFRQSTLFGWFYSCLFVSIRGSNELSRHSLLGFALLLAGSVFAAAPSPLAGAPAKSDPTPPPAPLKQHAGGNAAPTARTTALHRAAPLHDLPTPPLLM